MSALALLLVSFLLGAIPFGLLIGRIARGVDVREHGSGNLGATNVLRVAGPGWGLLALALDAAKGALPVALVPGWLGLTHGGAGSAWPAAAAIAAVCGHIFTPFARFRGGKGVATALGCCLALDPLSAAIGAGAFLAVVLACRYVSVGSMVMVTVFPLAILARRAIDPLMPAVGAGLVIASLVAWRHRANWARLARGEESRIGRKRGSEP
jgi:acyl phosphate:glycerol-3-phosphate acyltransferase